MDSVFLDMERKHSLLETTTPVDFALENKRRNCMDHIGKEADKKQEPPSLRASPIPWRYTYYSIASFIDKEERHWCQSRQSAES